MHVCFDLRHLCWQMYLKVVNLCSIGRAEVVVNLLIFNSIGRIHGYSFNRSLVSLIRRCIFIFIITSIESKDRLRRVHPQWDAAAAVQEASRRTLKWLFGLQRRTEHLGEKLREQAGTERSWDLLVTTSKKNSLSAEAYRSAWSAQHSAHWQGKLFQDDYRIAKKTNKVY